MIGPVRAPVGTTTVSVSPSLITGLAVLLPPKTMLVAFKFEPVIVTVWPNLAAAVVVATTAAWNTNLLVVVVPPALVALIFEPDTTPAGTVITTVVAVTMLKGAVTLPIVIDVAEARLVPLNAISDPTSLTTEAVIVITGFEVTDELAEKVLGAEAVPRVLVIRKVPFCVTEGDSKVILVPAAFTERTVTDVLIAASFEVAGV